MTIFQQEAIRLAELGYPLFPCKPGTKKPHNENGVSGATCCDLVQIEKWWHECKDANLGLGCHNCLIIDVDNKDGKNGDADFAEVVTQLGPLPLSPTVHSGGGGWHFYFAKPDQEIVGRKGIEWQGQKTGIDIQVGNQYVLAPPSLHTNEKPYEWIHPIVPVENLPELPQIWIDEFLPQRRALDHSRGYRPEENHPLPLGADTDHMNIVDQKIIERCRSYVAKMSPAIQGQQGSNITLQVANVIFHGFALSQEQGWPVFLEYNQRCEPPWSEKELAHKMQDAIHSPIDKPQGWLLNISPQSHLDIDLSRFMIDSKAKAKKKQISLIKTPEELFYVPGYVDQVMQWCLKSAPYPSLQLAFCGAMALQSFLCSRKVMTPGGIRPNLYLLGLGSSGAGKSQPRKINSRILAKTGFHTMLGNSISSGQALEDAIMAKHKMLLQTDEVDNMFRSMSITNDNNQLQLKSMVLQFYSEADDIHVRRLKANQQTGDVAYQPALVLFGTATPTSFCASLTTDMIVNGLFSRCIIIDVPERGRHKDSIDVSKIPEELFEDARWWMEFNPAPVNPKTGKPNDLNEIDPMLYEVPITDSAKSILNDFADLADDQYLEAERVGDDLRKAIWTRAYENSMRLALVYCCSRDKLHLVIDDQVAIWATRFGKQLVARGIDLVQKNTAVNEFHKECLQMARLLEKSRDCTMSHSAAARKMKGLNSRQFKELIETMISQGLLQVLPEGYPVASRGCSYQLIEPLEE